MSLKNKTNNINSNKTNMENPFNEIAERLTVIENKIDALNPPKKDIEIIDRTELCNRLGITMPTAIAREKKGDIPCFRIGINVRYNWDDVINKLGAKKRNKNLNRYGKNNKIKL